MNKKRILGIICAAVMITGLMGCGSSSSQDKASGDTPAKTEAAEEAEPAAEASDNSAAVDFPTKTMTIICPYAAGGGTDVALRILAECGGNYFGQTINVDNKTGGSGSIGLVETLNAAADGYTLGTASVDLITLPLLGLAPAEVTRDAFEPICVVNGEAAAIIVSADSEYDTLEDFVKAAVDNPGSIQLANAGMGNIWHLAAIGVELDSGASFNHIPYDGAAEAITGVLGGHVDAVICSIPEAAANIESGDLKVLGVAANERLESYPDVPTFKECGIDLTVMALRGLCVSSETPDDVVAVLRSGFEEVIGSDECREKVEAAGMTYMPLNAEETDAILDEMSGSFESIIEQYLSSN